MIIKSQTVSQKAPREETDTHTKAVSSRPTRIRIAVNERE